MTPKSQRPLRRIAAVWALVLCCCACAATPRAPSDARRASLGLSADHAVIVQALADAPDHGLPAQNLSDIVADLSSPSSARRARGETALAAAAAAYVEALHSPRPSPREIEPLWALEPWSRGISEELAERDFPSDAGDWIASFLPADPRYDALRAERRRIAAEEPLDHRRLIALDANLERWRWLPLSLPARRIEVDIVAAEVTYFERDTARMRMRAVVGRPHTPTPIFASHIDAIVLNPSWIVPTSIARNELLPRAEADPDYLQSRNFVRTETGLRQLPGPDNALGRVKFDMLSPFSVYLHDTPARDAFNREDRHLSHGCVRLEQPRALASLLLERQGFTEAMVDAAIEAGDTQRIDLVAPTPVYFLYWTSVAAPGGVSYRDDVYGWDERLVAARRRQAISRANQGLTNAASAGCGQEF